MDKTFWILAVALFIAAVVVVKWCDLGRMTTAAAFGAIILVWCGAGLWTRAVELMVERKHYARALLAFALPLGGVIRSVTGRTRDRSECGKKGEWQRRPMGNGPLVFERGEPIKFGTTEVTAYICHYG